MFFLLKQDTGHMGVVLRESAKFIIFEHITTEMEYTAGSPIMKIYLPELQNIPLKNDVWIAALTWSVSDNVSKMCQTGNFNYNHRQLKWANEKDRSYWLPFK